MAASKQGRRISKPREHGAYLTVIAAGLAATALAPDRLASLCFGAAALLGFLARGPIDRMAVGGRRGRWDAAALVAGGAVALVLAWRAAAHGPVFGALALTAVMGLPLASALLRRSRMQRSVAVELVAMAGLAATGGVALLAGGGPWRVAGGLGVVLVTHALVSVPLVRAELHRGERHRELPAAAAGLATLVLVGVGLWLAGMAPVALALVPRLAQLGGQMWRRRAGPERRISPARLGLLETAALVGCAALAVVLLAGGNH
jgi:hypothetical protein